MFWQELRRRSIPQSLRTKLLLRCKGKCEMCGLNFEKEGVRPHFHHKDGDPANNKPTNIIVICPNCHTKLHKWKDVEEPNIFGFMVRTRKPVTMRPKKAKKTGKSKNLKRRKASAKRRRKQNRLGVSI